MAADRGEGLWSGLRLCVATCSGFSPKGGEAAATTSGGAKPWGQVWAASCSPVCFQDPALKLCLVQSVCMASQAICSSAQANSFHFSQKAELVAQMMVSAARGLGQTGGTRIGGPQRPLGWRDGAGLKPVPGLWLTEGQGGGGS